MEEGMSHTPSELQSSPAPQTPGTPQTQGDLATQGQTQETRPFSVHPSIIHSLIREQASSLEKALAELVMNGMDAGATEIRITIDPDGFVVEDNGRGFADRAEVESVFGVFGAPHEDGDAYFGRYRVGRGQVMAHAAVTWRSGHYSMSVDLGLGGGALAYQLTTHEQSAPGCTVSGVFYNSRRGNPHAWSSAWLSLEHSELATLIRYMDVAVSINGVLVTRRPQDEKWDLQDENARYRFCRDDHEMVVYDRGLRVQSFNAGRFYGRGGTIVSKCALKLNMARNEIAWDCEVWRKINAAVQTAFELRVSKAKKLDDAERRHLVASLLTQDSYLSAKSRQAVCGLKFIEDVNGELRTPLQMLGGADRHATSMFTRYDARYPMVCERVQREGLATVLPQWLFGVKKCKSSEQEDEHALQVVHALRQALGLLGRNGRTEWIALSHFVETLSDTHAILSEDDLSDHERLVLKAVRDVNGGFRLEGGAGRRKIVVGCSDGLAGWTDGYSYIALERRFLARMRRAGGHGAVMSVLAHEYCHDELTAGEHAHDFRFYERFHRMTQSATYFELCDLLLRKYVAGLAAAQLIPSGPVGYLVDRMALLQGKLKRRRTAALGA